MTKRIAFTAAFAGLFVAAQSVLADEAFIRDVEACSTLRDSAEYRRCINRANAESIDRSLPPEEREVRSRQRREEAEAEAASKARKAAELEERERLIREAEAELEAANKRAAAAAEAEEKRERAAAAQRAKKAQAAAAKQAEIDAETAGARNQVARDYEKLLRSIFAQHDYIKVRVHPHGRDFALFGEHPFFNQYTFQYGGAGPRVEAWIRANRSKLEQARVYRIGVRSDNRAESYFSLR